MCTTYLERIRIYLNFNKNLYNWWYTNICIYTKLSFKKKKIKKIKSVWEMNMDDVTHCPPNWPIQVLQITIIIIYLCFILTTAKFIWHENILSLKMHKNEKKVFKFIFNFAIQFAKFTQHENAFSLKHTISTHTHKNEHLQLTKNIIR